jgi:hypothetical protein
VLKQAAQQLSPGAQGEAMQRFEFFNKIIYLAIALVLMGLSIEKLSPAATCLKLDHKSLF